MSGHQQSILDTTQKDLYDLFCFVEDSKTRVKTIVEMNPNLDSVPEVVVVVEMIFDQTRSNLQVRKISRAKVMSCPVMKMLLNHRFRYRSVFDRF